MQPRKIEIRPAQEVDLADICRIYNHEVANGVATFDIQPWTADGQRAWFAEHGTDRNPLLVATDGDVLAWGSLSRWSTRCAYETTAEVSLYVDEKHRGRGLGAKLLEELIARARAAKMRVLLARIESSGAASLNLHRRHGFTAIGTMHRVGEKFGRILDVEMLELLL